MLRETLFGVLILSAIVATGASADDGNGVGRDLDKYPIRFAILGDRTGEAQPGIYEQIVSEIERLKPEFVITVGDMIEGPAPDSAAWHERWLEYSSIVSQLSAPVYYVPGNNDIWSDGDVDSWVQHIGQQPFYSFEYESIHIVVLDNSRWDRVGEFPGEQIDWLVGDLTNNAEAEYTLVFHHKPFWYRTVADNKPDTLHNLFRTYGVDAVFSGHFHRYFVGEFDGIKYTNVGSSGGHAEPQAWEPAYHFMWVTMDNDGITMAPIEVNSVLPWREVEVAGVRYHEAARRLGIEFASEAKVSEGSLEVSKTVVSVDIKNMNGDLALADTARWSVPDGWTIEPLAVPVTVQPGQTGRLDFEVSSTGSLYPLPEFSLSFPFNEATSFEAKKHIRVAREAECAFTSDPPSIDGIVDEKVWQNPSAGLLASDGSPSDVDSTLFYFAYDSENLYLAVYCAEKNVDSMRAEMTGHDDDIYTEDCVGFLYRPISAEDAVYQLYINPLGATFDQKITRGSDGYWSGTLSWDGEYESVARVSADSWAIEMRIPLNQFGTEVESGQHWDFNFRRKQFRCGSAGGWQIPHAYDPNGFGKLVFHQTGR